MQNSLLVFFAWIFMWNLNGSPQGKDHPLFTRYPGAEIVYQQKLDFRQQKFAIGHDRGNPNIWQAADGMSVSFLYQVDQATSINSISEYYSRLIQRRGMIIYQCSSNQGPSDCEQLTGEQRTRFYQKTFENRMIEGHDLTEFMNQVEYYLVGRIASLQKTTYVEIGVAPDRSGGWWISKNVVESGPEGDLVLGEINIDDNINLDIDGKIVLEGSSQAAKFVLTEHSEGELAMVAKYLLVNHETSVFIVGHVDDAFSYQENMNRSVNLAKSVYTRLVNEYRLDPNRMEVHGVGSLCPVSPFLPPAERLKNQRVEIVKRITD